MPIPYDDPPFRPLKVYATDPSRGQTLGNHMTVEVPFEKLENGLTGRYLRVVDYDASNERYYQPVDLNHPSVLMQGGLEPSESDPRFHQQMTYAVASRTIQLFEFALGRKIKWGFGRNKVPLRIFPHAMQEANAFYSRDLGALLFGYFPASEDNPGSNLPGQTIFTCLSHDIIAHETTHALVDGQRRLFMDATGGPDNLAFHEAFADIVALFQHFSFNEVLVDVIKKTGGRIFEAQTAPDVESKDGETTIGAQVGESNPLVDLAKQFGEALGQRAALRKAIGQRTDPTILDSLEDPHDRGAILVAAVFDAFFTIYMRRVGDLLQIARMISTDEIHPNLVKRLADEAAKVADHFCNICIRALDYCPPVDITFGDFLRALITADYDLVPDDPHGYRAALIDAFRSRGIRPQGVASYAEESLRWSRPEAFDGTPLVCKGLTFDLFRPVSPTANQNNAKALHAFAEANKKPLGFKDGAGPISVHSFHPLHRVAPDGGIKMEAVAEVIQRIEVLVDPDDPDGEKMEFFGGVTLIIDLSPDKEGWLRYAVSKHVGDDPEHNTRLRLQREFAGLRRMKISRSVFSDVVESGGLNFKLVHRGF